MSSAWLNGEILDDPRISAADRGFLLGDGIFETLRVYDGVPFLLEAHLERLRDGCRRLGIPLTVRPEEGVQAVLTADTALRTGALRVTVSRGPGAGLAPPVKSEPTVLVTFTPYRAESAWYRDGMSAVLSVVSVNECSPTAGLKTTTYLDSILALEEARERGAEEAFLLNRCGHVTRATAANIFTVTGDALRTPPLSSGALPGITREVVLNCAPGLGLRPECQTPLLPSDLRAADEVFVTSSLRELVSVVSVDGARVGSGSPGPRWRDLRAAYLDVVRENTGDSVS